MDEADGSGPGPQQGCGTGSGTEAALHASGVLETMQSILETIETNAKLFRVAYLSEVTGISAKSIYKAIDSGSLAAYRLGGAIWIEPRAAAKWFKDHCTKN